MRAARLSFCIAWFGIAALVPPAAVLAACGSSRENGPVDDDAGDSSSERAEVVADAGMDVVVDPVCGLPGVYGSEECTYCLKSRCCGVITACEANEDCQPLNRCVLGCLPDPDAGGCRVGCEAQFPKGKSGMLAIVRCAAGEDSEGGCRTVCGTTSQ